MSSIKIDALELQDSFASNGLRFEFRAGGPDDIAEFVGADDDVPGASGMDAARWKVRGRHVKLYGCVIGEGADPEAQQQSYRTRMDALVAKMDVATLVTITAQPTNFGMPTGFTYTLERCRPQRMVWIEKAGDFYATLMLEFFSLAGEWTPAPPPPEFVEGAYLSNTASSGLEWDPSATSTLLVVVAMWQDSATDAALTYAGTPMAAIEGSRVTHASVIPGRADHTTMEAFYALNPSSGGFVGFNQSGYHAYALFGGVDQSSPAVVATNSGTSAAPSVAAPSTAGTLPFAIAGGFGGSDTANPTADAPATQVWGFNANTGLGPIDFAGSYDDASAGFTMGSSKPWVAIGLAIRGG